MKSLLKVLFFLFVLSGCKFFNESFDLDRIKDPEKDIYRIFEAFEIESVSKEHMNNDDHMDILIVGTTELGEWIDAYFIHNGDQANTYRYMSGDDYWESYNPDSYDTFEKVEDYFQDMQDYNEIEQIIYEDLNQDGKDDALVISFYSSEEFSSIDAYLFIGVEGGYLYDAVAETYYPATYDDFNVFQNAFVKDGYFTIELEGMQPYWERHITFAFDEDEETFVLYKDGGVVEDMEGNVLRDEVLTQNDFGTVYFYEFVPDKRGLFSLKQEAKVSNVKELLSAIENNRTIYLSEGIYYLNDLKQLPKEAQENFEKSAYWGTFYTSEFYAYEGAKANETALALSLHELRNVDFIGVGNVQFVVTDEMVSVLALENCENIYFENIYMVHDVGGLCGANVVDLDHCYDLEFFQCTFDGSGQLAVFANASYDLYFVDSYFTNCTDGALDFYDSDAVFETCIFKDNTIWYALIAGYSYSSLGFHECTFSKNKEVDSDYIKDPRHLFYVQDESYIYIDEKCVISADNLVEEIANDNKFITVADGVIF